MALTGALAAVTGIALGRVRPRYGGEKIMGTSEETPDRRACRGVSDL